MPKLLANIILHGLVALLLATAACVERTPLPASTANDGIITGRDARRCMCCGGWFVDIQGQTYRFMTLPKDADIELETYPVSVTLDWEVDPEACLGDEILVHSIEEK